MLLEEVKIRKKIKSIKTIMITGLLLLSVFIALTPNSSAGILINFSNTIFLTWENRSGEPIVPYIDIRPYQLNLVYTVTGGPFGRLILYPLLYEDRRIDIKLSIKDYPDWATVDLPHKTIPANVPKIGELKTYELEISISLKEDAPAYETGLIYIQIKVPQLGHIEGFDQTISLPFKPAYRALIDVNPQVNSKRIDPMDVAVFPIDVINHGNGRTKCFFEVNNDLLPDGWSAVIDDSVIIETGKGAKETVYLTVYPPEGFVFHDNIANIQVIVTPKWAENIEIKGSSETLTVTVEIEGASFNGNNKKEGLGIEIYALIIAVIIIVIYILVLILLIVKKRL